MSRRRGCVERFKALLSLVTCLWCPPIMTGFIWAIVTYFGGGLLCAYLIGVRPYGILSWSNDGLFNFDPPENMSVFVSAGPHSGIVPFVRIDGLGVVPDRSGWYTIPPANGNERPYWLAGSEQGPLEQVASGSAINVGIGSRDLYLHRLDLREVDSETNWLKMRMMERNGGEVIVEQEYRDGAVRPLRYIKIPDAVPALGGATMMTALYSALSLVPVSCFGALGYVMSRRLRQTLHDDNIAYEPS